MTPPDRVGYDPIFLFMSGRAYRGFVPSAARSRIRAPKDLKQRNHRLDCRRCGRRAI